MAFSLRNLFFNLTMGIICFFFFLLLIIFPVSSEDPIPVDTIHSRTATTDTYRTTDGYFRTVQYAGTVNYEDNGTYLPIDGTIGALEFSIGTMDYSYGVEKGLYQAYFKESSTLLTPGSKPVAMVKDDYVFTFTPAVSTDRYINFNLDCNGSNFGKRIAAKQSSNIVIDGDTATYPNQYKQYQKTIPFANLTYRYLNDRIKEELVIWDKDWIETRYNNCYDDFHESAVMEFTMDTKAFYSEDASSNSMGIKVSQASFKDFGNYSDNEITTTDEVHFTDSSGETIFYIPELYAEDSNGSRILLNKTLKMVAGGSLRTIILTPYSWLSNESTVYPVYIDPTVTYEFVSETNIWAYEGDACIVDYTNPPYRLDVSTTSYTGSSALHEDDTTYKTISCGAITDQVVYYVFNITQPVDEITSIDSEFIHKNTWGTPYTHKLFVYNYSSTSYVQVDSKLFGAFSEGTLNYVASELSLDFIDKGILDIALTRERYTTLADYVSLEVTFDALIVNTPADDKEILNTLSTTLNTSQAGYNETIWYSFNNGITNATLCTTSNECEDTITFPRQGIYNLTIYGNKSDGAETSQTVSNLFVGNKNIRNFNATYQGTSIWAFDKEYFNSITPPPNSNPPLAYDNEVTSHVALDTDDGDRHKTIASFTYNSYILFNSTFTLRNDVYNLTWQYNGHADLSSGEATLHYYIWNYTASSWYECANPYSSSSDITRLCSVTSTDFISSDNLNTSTFLVWHKVISFGGHNWIESDFVDVTAKFIINNQDPAVNLVTPNNTNFTTSNVNLTYNYTDDNDYVSNVSLYIDGVFNQSRGAVGDLDTNLNFTIPSISDGTYTYLVSITDSDGEQTNSSENTFTVDSTGPSVTIVHPVDFASYSTNTIDLNYTVSDAGVGLETCVYQNNTDANVTIVCGTNTTINQATEDTFTVTVCANDTLGNIGCDTNQFRISTTAPAIVLDSPLTNTYFNIQQNIYLNYTATDTNLIDTCEVWGNWTGDWHKNSTNYGVTTAQQNFTIINASGDGFWKWNVWCNDTNGDDTFATTNFTFTTDTIYPVPNITAIQTTVGSQTVRFNHTSLDINLASCKYSVFNSTGGIDGSYENTSVSCNTNLTQVVVSEFGTYDLTLYAIDLAGNENLTTEQFITADTPAAAPPSGGGGSTSNETIIIVVGENVTWSVTTDTRTNKFDLIMVAGSERERRLIFTNLADNPLQIKVRCDNLEGALCQYISFLEPDTEDLDQQTFLTQMSLVGSTNEEIVQIFKLNLPDNLEDGVYDFNLVGVDQEGNEASVSVRVRVGTFGFFSLLIDKFLGDTAFDLSFISDNLKDVNIPNIILLILPILLLAPLLWLLLGNLKSKILYVVFIPLAAIIAIFIFID